MKKRYWIAPGAVAIAFAGVAVAATISNINGQSCGTDTGTWHFINNQTGGAAAGTLNATWSSGDSCTVTASKVLRQHPTLQLHVASGALTSASTNLPGRLVLSDFSCQTKEPPPCDPKNGSLQVDD